MTPYKKEVRERFKKRWEARLAPLMTNPRMTQAQREAASDLEIDSLIDEVEARTREEVIRENFTKIGMNHVEKFCRILKSAEAKGKDVMYIVRAYEQSPFPFKDRKEEEHAIKAYIASMTPNT